MLDHSPPNNVALYTFSLNFMPSESLSIAIDSSDPSVTISPSSFIIGGSYPINQLVTFAGDAVSLGSVTVSVEIEGLPSQSVTVDRPQEPLRLSIAPTSLSIAELSEGSEATFVVSLNRSSLSPVEVSLISPNPAIVVSPNSFELGGAYPIDRTVTVRGYSVGPDPTLIQVNSDRFSTRFISVVRSQVPLEFSVSPTDLALERVPPGNEMTFTVSLIGDSSNASAVSVTSSDPTVTVSPATFELGGGHPASQAVTVTSAPGGPDSVSISVTLPDLGTKFVNVTRKAFEPTAIPGLSLWLDASDIDSLVLDDSNNVSQWNDKSGNGRHLVQSTILKRPSLVAGVVNGLPVVRTNGANSQLLSSLYPATDWYGSGGDQVTIVYVVKRVGATGRFFHALTENINSGASVQCFLMDRQPASVGISDFIVKSNSYYSSLTAAPEIGTAISIESIRWKSGSPFTLRRFISGSATEYSSRSSVNGAMSAAQRYAIGSTVASLAVEADFCEISVFSRNLSDFEIQQIESYLANKWGL